MKRHKAAIASSHRFERVCPVMITPLSPAVRLQLLGHQRTATARSSRPLREARTRAARWPQQKFQRRFLVEVDSGRSEIQRRRQIREARTRAPSNREALGKLRRTPFLKNGTYWANIAAIRYASTLARARAHAAKWPGSTSRSSGDTDRHSSRGKPERPEAASGGQINGAGHFASGTRCCAGRRRCGVGNWDRRHQKRRIRVQGAPVTAWRIGNFDNLPRYMTARGRKCT